MTPSRLLGLAAILELLEGVVADRLQHREPRLCRCSPRPPDQALVGEAGDLVQHRQRRFTYPDPHVLSRRQGEAADEHGQAAEQCPLLLREQVVTPGNGAPHRAQPLWLVAGTAGEESEPVA